MKLRALRLYRLDLTLRTPFTTSFGTYRTLPRPFVVLETADGRRGVGEAPTLLEPAYKAEADTPAVVTSLQEFILPSIARAQAARGEIASVPALRDSYAWIKGAVFAKSAVEAAFWDLHAQAAEAPLWRLWGGDRRTFPVGVSIGGKTLADVARLAENAVALGYRRLKVKIWPGFDVEPATALRERFPDILLQVDANSAYSVDNWVRLKALDPLDLLLIEQPLYDDDIVLHSEISRELRTPICLDESIHSLRDARAAMRLWSRNDNLDRLIVNIKPPRVSGFAEAIEIARACRERRVRTWIGGMLDSAWGKALNLNLNALSAIDLPGDHFSPSGAYFERDVTCEPLVSQDGSFTLGDGVSAGVTFDWEFFKSSAEELFRLDLDA
ncbi:MAG TPA: o-succinylbenzoate synthase [Thermomicrobiales bacterium]|nr:o-succinylbenzoate synthase [Thermomicrobiales bacterium]